MFDQLIVKSSFGDYEVDFTPWEKALNQVVKRRDIIIADKNVVDLYPNIARENTSIILIEPSENEKSYANIGSIMHRILEMGFSRGNKLIAFGGGITQDITSFSASVLMRGVPWIFFPTNLLSQCDSCIGSKTSVNLGKLKNQLGGFYPPHQVFIDTSFCNSLNARDISSGLGEMMHYFLVDGSLEIDQLGRMVDRARSEPTFLATLIKKSLSIKKTMVEIDELDQGPRCVFNYGHTFGHAIEACTHYSIPHGIAVAYGMDLSNFISSQLGYVDTRFRNDVRPVLEKIWFGFDLPHIHKLDYMNALKRDKKSIPGHIRPILTRGRGQMFQDQIEIKKHFLDSIDYFFSNKIYGRDI